MAVRKIIWPILIISILALSSILLVGYFRVEPEEKLTKALVHLNEKEILEAIDNGAPVDIRMKCVRTRYKNCDILDYQENTALMQASRQGNYILAKELVERGANVNLLGYEKRSALSFAFPYDSKAFSKNPPDFAKNQRDNRARIIFLLLDNGADIKVPGAKRCETLLGSAILFGNVDIIQALLDREANVNEARPRYDYMNCTYARESKSGSMSIPSPENNHFYSIALPLALAAYEGNTKIIELLIEYGANINDQDEFGKTALMYAIEGNHPETVKVLVSKGANPNIQDKMGRNALEYAEGNKQLAAFLVSLNAH